MTVADLITFLKQIQSERSRNTSVVLRVGKDEFGITSLEFVRKKVNAGKSEDVVYICAPYERTGAL